MSGRFDPNNAQGMGKVKSILVTKDLPQNPQFTRLELTPERIAEELEWLSKERDRINAEEKVNCCFIVNKYTGGKQPKNLRILALARDVLRSDPRFKKAVEMNYNEYRPMARIERSQQHGT